GRPAGRGRAAETNPARRRPSVMGAGARRVGFCSHRKPVQDAAVAPDGERLLSYTVEGRDVYLWDAGGSRLAVPPLRHNGEVRHACYRWDGRLVGTAAADGTACVWDAADRQRLRQPDHPTRRAAP